MVGWRCSASRSESVRVQALDPTTASSHSGVYTNAALGEVRLALQGDKFMLHTGELASELRSLEEATFVLWDPPLAGALIQFDKGGAGEPASVFKAESPDLPEQYRFTKAPSPTAAAPANQTSAAAPTSFR